MNGLNEINEAGLRMTQTTYNDFDGCSETPTGLTQRLSEKLFAQFKHTSPEKLRKFLNEFETTRYVKNSAKEAGISYEVASRVLKAIGVKPRSASDGGHEAKARMEERRPDTPAHVYSKPFTPEWAKECNDAFVARMLAVHPDKEVRL